MARIALPHPHRGGDSRAGNALLALLLFLSAAALAAVLSMMPVPSVATHGLPAGWAQRAAWLAVDALVGLGVACGLMAMAERGRSRSGDL